MSPALESAIEQFRFDLQMSEFDESKHLKEREDQYVWVGVGPGILVVKETPDGWWREDIKLKSDVKQQIEKLVADPAIACVWLRNNRFAGSGGWDDPNG